MKFKFKDIVRHIKTDTFYQIVGTPDHYRIEATNEPAYAYTDANDDPIWIRSQVEMEDGRFELNISEN